jgi:7-cyano-7-deazaguanine synthase
MDSAAIAWWHRPELAIFIDYGQRPAKAERRAAEAVAEAAGIRLEAIKIDCSPLGTGLLAGTAQIEGAPTAEWWPYRNQLLVTFAANVALRQDANISEIMVGTVSEDKTNGDGSEAFIAALDVLLSLQEHGLRVSAPAIHLTSAELVKDSGVPAEVLGWTHSCFVSDIPCLRCRGCGKHLGALEAIGRRWPDVQV